MQKVIQAVVLASKERECFGMPAGFLKLDGQTIIERLITVLSSMGINDITIVTGYKKEYYDKLAKKRNFNLIYDEKYREAGSMHGLAMAEKHIKGDFILIEDNSVFEENAAKTLAEDENDICAAAKGIFKISFGAYKKVIEYCTQNGKLNLDIENALREAAENEGLSFKNIEGFAYGTAGGQKEYETLRNEIYPKLLEKERLARMEYAREKAAEILNVPIAEIKDIEQLGGLSNRNYKITVKGEDLVIRIAGNGQFTDRENERINSSIAYGIGLDCKTLYFNEETGIKICEYIKDARTMNPEEAKKEHNMELIANALRTLHECGKMFKIDFDPFKDTLYYESELLKANGKVFEGYEEEKQKFLPLKDELEKLGMVMAPCHLDALPENFVKSGEDRIYLIDWEFSGNYDRLWDVASVIVECGYSKEEEELFLNKYFLRQPTEAERKRILIHKISQDMCWCMWAAAKAAQGADYLEEYSLDRFNRGKILLNEYLKGGII